MKNFRSWRGSEKQLFHFLLLSKEENFIAFLKEESQFYERFVGFGKLISISGFWSFIKLHYLIRKENIQTIVAYNSKSHNYGLVLKFLNRNVRFIVHRKIRRNNLRKSFKYRTKLVDAFICVSEYIKNNLIRCGIDPKKIFVSHDSFVKDRDFLLHKKERTREEKREIQRINSFKTSEKSNRDPQSLESLRKK